MAAVPLTRLGKYEILAPLAEGGMAELYLARLTGISGFRKLIVLKCVRALLAHDPEMLRMFLDEARIAATLHHPNIVQVFDSGEIEGRHFFSMEFVQGADLQRIIRRLRAQNGRLAVDHVVSIMLSVCSALQYAHDRIGADGSPAGIVHRDVSPQNVMVTFDGGVKLLDFGIAKMREKTWQTRQGTLKGKISYMSPEQCQELSVDGRSDLFALGAMAWEMLTGAVLYDGANDLEILKRITEHEAPPPSRLRPELPAGLERVVQRCLARNPDDRYGTAGEVFLALEEVARELRYTLSTEPLARFMRSQFREEIAAFQAAEQKGHLAAYLASRAASTDDLSATGAEASTAPRTRPLLSDDAAPADMLAPVGYAALGLARASHAVAFRPRKGWWLAISAAAVALVGLGVAAGRLSFWRRSPSGAIPLVPAVAPVEPGFARPVEPGPLVAETPSLPAAPPVRPARKLERASKKSRGKAATQRRQTAVTSSARDLDAPLIPR
jgi:serine/threonine protein kinase